jgi:hypothetical protein
MANFMSAPENAENYRRGSLGVNGLLLRRS